MQQHGALLLPPLMNALPPPLGSQALELAPRGPDGRRSGEAEEEAAAAIGLGRGGGPEGEERKTAGKRTTDESWRESG